MPYPGPPWEDRFLFRSRDVDETRAFFDPFGLRFDPIGSDRALDARFDGELLSGIYLSFVQFGAAAVVRANWETGYAVKLPLRGGFEAVSRPPGTIQFIVPTAKLFCKKRSGSPFALAL